jgi:hypothetical protein
MSPIQIEMAINAIVVLIQVLTTQLAQAEGLTAEQKQVFLDRITAAQSSIPKWE